MDVGLVGSSRLRPFRNLANLRNLRPFRNFRIFETCALFEPSRKKHDVSVAFFLGCCAPVLAIFSSFNKACRRPDEWRGWYLCVELPQYPCYPTHNLFSSLISPLSLPTSHHHTFHHHTSHQHTSHHPSLIITSPITSPSHLHLSITSHNQTSPNIHKYLASLAISSSTLNDI